jgi:hypothetical protein
MLAGKTSLAILEDDQLNGLVPEAPMPKPLPTAEEHVGDVVFRRRCAGVKAKDKRALFNLRQRSRVFAVAPQRLARAKPRRALVARKNANRRVLGRRRDFEINNTLYLAEKVKERRRGSDIANSARESGFPSGLYASKE